MTTLVVLAAIMVVLFAIGFVISSLNTIEQRQKKAVYSYVKKRYLMTRSEHDCYKLLARALAGDYFVFAQVHLPQIVSEKVPKQNWRAARAHIDRKSVDFVVTDTDTISPLLAIELDDWSHNREDRQERDREVERILGDAGVPLLRITDMEDLAVRVRNKLNSLQPV